MTLPFKYSLKLLEGAEGERGGRGKCEGGLRLSWGKVGRKVKWRGGKVRRETGCEDWQGGMLTGEEGKWREGKLVERGRLEAPSPVLMLVLSSPLATISGFCSHTI